MGYALELEGWAVGVMDLVDEIEIAHLILSHNVEAWRMESRPGDIRTAARARTLRSTAPSSQSLTASIQLLQLLFIQCSACLRSVSLCMDSCIGTILLSSAIGP